MRNPFAQAFICAAIRIPGIHRPGEVLQQDEWCPARRAKPPEGKAGVADVQVFRSCGFE